MSVLLVRDDREYLCRPGEELQTDLGVLTVPESPNPGETIETHLGEVFRLRRPRLPDLFRHLERTGAPMMPRDIGLGIGIAGLEADDRVLDVGTGTGILAAALGRLHARVVTYERDPDFATVARSNMERAGVSDRVDVRTGDVLDEIDDLGGFDAVTLDTGDAPRIVGRVEELVESGPAIAYSPFVEDAREIVLAARDAELRGLETFDSIHRPMDFDERGSRPSTGAVGHTGYLTVAWTG